MKKSTIAILCPLCSVAVFFLFGCVQSDHPHSLLYQEGIILMAHAMGGIDGMNYTNSLEAFRKNYAEGKRIFEVDFKLTTDGGLAAFHDDTLKRLGEKGEFRLSTEEFRRKKIYGKYTPLTGEDVVQLVHDHPDVLMILDIKDDFAESLKILAEDIEKTDGRMFARFLPQIYFEPQLDVVKGYPFTHSIFSLYQGEASDEDVLQFARNNEWIWAVSMNEKRFSPTLAYQLQSAQKRVLVHTIDDPKTVEAYAEKHVTGIFNDFLPGLYFDPSDHE